MIVINIMKSVMQRLRQALDRRLPVIEMYRKTSNIMSRTFFYYKIALKVRGCVLSDICPDIVYSLFQIETIVENETAALQRRRRRMSKWVAGE